MPADSDTLRIILKQYVGPAYDRALRNTGSEAKAKEATHRAMELLKRSCQEGVEPTKALVLRITDDCCDQGAFFNKQPDATPAAPKAQKEAPAIPASQAQAQKAQAVKAAPATQTAFLRPTPAAEVGARPIPARELAQELGAKPAIAGRMPARATAPTQEELDLYGLLDEEKSKKALEGKGRVSPGSVLLVMFLSLIVVLLVIILVVMLAAKGSASDGAPGFASDFAAWFNSHIFPLY